MCLPLMVNVIESPPKLRPHMLESNGSVMALQYVRSASHTRRMTLGRTEDKLIIACSIGTRYFTKTRPILLKGNHAHVSPPLSFSGREVIV